MENPCPVTIIIGKRRFVAETRIKRDLEEAPIILSRNSMGSLSNSVICVCFQIAILGYSLADDPYRFFTWHVTWGTIRPLGIPQQGILINGKFPGPQIDVVTNDNIVLNVFNNLDEGFLISWRGIQQRKNPWQDGVFGTNCPIPPGKNFTYKFHVKDQVGSYYYFPSLYMHKAAGGFGGLNVASRPLIPVPFPAPDGDITLLIGDWYKTNHSILRRTLDMGSSLGQPDAILINGHGPSSAASITVDKGKTYRLRISNVGLSSSLNFKIQGHKLKLVEVEGSHTIQNVYDSLDIHVGQSYSVLVTTNQPPRDYYMVASTRFTSPVLFGIATFHYSNSHEKVSGSIPQGLTSIDQSLSQARSIRWNLTASAARPNPQGTYHYGSITINRTIVVANSARVFNGKQRYAVNNVSYVNPSTPLQLADYYNISGVYTLGGIPDSPNGESLSGYLQTALLSVEYRAFVEIVFQNNENTVQSWHLDGYSFFVVGMEGGTWTPARRKRYNMFDAVSRCTTQVYPRSWTAVLVTFDNAGVWNLRSETWPRQFLGQQTYVRVKPVVRSTRDEYDIPDNAILCAEARRFVD